jgi:phosphoglycerol transferase MdoB-like AlkP superfamily enzyme
MMFFQKIKIDERTRSNTRYAAAIWLGITQLLLAGVLFYRLYVLGQADEQLRDFQAVLGISIFGHLALQLFLGGVMPIPTWRGALVSYLALSALIITGCLIIYGWPAPADWAITWLPALLGPALMVGGYALVANLGQWRIERQIAKLDE